MGRPRVHFFFVHYTGDREDEVQLVSSSSSEYDDIDHCLDDSAPEDDKDGVDVASDVICDYRRRRRPHPRCLRRQPRMISP